ncbi:hypothetical protein G6F43_004655 [Rhizopus delemar]|nr:hypothetical protein G6F43_004655 [Rhizopus delemar]
MSTKLKQLLKRSEVLSLTQDQTGIPIVGNDFERLARQVKAGNEKIQYTKEQQAKAHYFLANNGIKGQADIEPVSIRYAFDTIQTSNYTDIEKFLNEEHERILIDVIEEQRRQDDNDFQQFYNAQLDTYSKETEQEQKEKEEQHNVDPSELADNMTRINQYSQIIKALNDCRINNNDYELVERLVTVQNASDLKKSQTSVSQAWNILSYFIKHTDNEGRHEGRFTKSYLTQPYQSTAAINTRRALIDASRSWLEEQFLQTVNEQLHAHATKLKMGGNPFITHRLRAYIDVNYKTNSGWKEEGLEIVNELPIWLFIYLLLRTGHKEAAADYINKNKDMFSLERKFVDYFQEYMESSHHCVSKTTHDEILADYYVFEYGEQKADPYKSLVYKIIGRCELNKKTTRIMKNQEDYLWLQLVLLREVTDTERYAYERYRLEDLKQIISVNEDQNTDVWAHFKTLLLTLQFEKAIGYIYSQKKLLLETTHFASALVYYGLLRIPSATQAKIDKTMLITNQEGLHLFNFSRLIYQYIQTYISDRPIEILQYLYLLSLYSTKQGYHNNDMVSLAKSYASNIIAKNKNYREFLDIIYAQREPSIIESQKVLLDINSEQEYAEQILYPIASILLQSSRCREAVSVYKLSFDSNKLYEVLAKELSDALQHTQSTRFLDPKLSYSTNQEMIEFATEAVEDYKNQQHLKLALDAKKVYTVHTLIQLLQFRMFYEEGQYHQAIATIQSMNIVPFNDQFNFIQQAADRFEQLDETIRKNIPEILLNIMDIFHKIWESYMSASVNVAIPNNTIEDIEKNVRAVLTFVGIIQFNIPADILVKLNRIDMIMAQRRKFIET